MSIDRGSGESVAPGHPFRHRAICYASPERLVDLLVTVAQSAFARGEPVWAVLDRPTAAALLDRLGPAGAGVMIVEPADLHGWSGQSTAARCASMLRERTADGQPLIVVIQHTAAFDGPKGAYWGELDAAFNIALPGLPITMICAFPEQARAGVLDGMYRTHPELVVERVIGNPRYRHAPPPDRTTAAAAPPLGPATGALAFGAGSAGLAELRSQTGRYASVAGLDRQLAEDLVLAVDELASNSIEHGAGHGTATFWVWPGRVIAEVHDAGKLTVALPGLRPPDPEQPRGRGVWLSRQLCTTVHLWSAADGTRARVECAAA